MSSTEALEKELVDSQTAVTIQGDTVRSLKAALKDGKADKVDVDAAIGKLKQLKADMESKQKAYEAVAGKTTVVNKEAFRAALTNTLERRFFYIPSFKIYGSVAGFYDFGPPGCAIKQNIQQFWRQHFVLEESMLEVECPAVTPDPVLRASGHVDRFTDYMVTDLVTGDCHRADHLLKAALEALVENKAKPPSPDELKEIRHTLATVDELDAGQLGEQLTKYGVKAPDTANNLSAPFRFNLMFRTSIGPKGDQVGYLRPETAQGIFVNFRDLLYYNGNKLPFAAAQIGQSYRNEISPRAGLLRVREFTQAEIEHFCNPQDKSHAKFVNVADLDPLLFSRELQMGEEKVAKPMRLGDAVASKVIANETLGYFIGRTYQFMLKIGINPARMRFRQHLPHEMAHYAEDCWDAEVECSYGWVECAGLADRSAFDLRAHSNASRQDLTAFEKYNEDKVMEVLTLVPNKKRLGEIFRREAKPIQEALEAIGEESIACLQEDLLAGKPGKVQVGPAKEISISADMVDIKKITKKVSGRKFIPSVIEPSFGIGRIIYCMFEHCYYLRDGDEKRTVFRFTPVVAPVKATVFPLVAKAELNALATDIASKLTKAGLSSIVDTTGNTIGKRYARTDEIGVPFGVTVDRTSLEDQTVTVRERDSTAQVRVPIEEVPGLLRQLADMDVTWDEVRAKYPAQQSASDE